MTRRPCPTSTPRSPTSRRWRTGTTRSTSSPAAASPSGSRRAAGDRWPIDGRAPDGPAGRPRDGPGDGGQRPGKPVGDVERARPTWRQARRREPTGPAPAHRSTARAADPPSMRPASPGPRRPPPTASTSPPPRDSAARCSASCPTGSSPARRPRSTMPSCRPSPTSRSGPTARGTCGRRIATGRTRPAGEAGRAPT